MKLVRIAAPDLASPVMAVLDEDQVRPLAPARSLAELLALTLDDVRTALETAGPPRSLAEVDLLAPLDDHSEVWAAGVTYESSRLGRLEESDDGDVYSRVYAATRPELFFKSLGWRTVTDGQPVALRSDSTNDVPEPELALVVNAHQEIVAFAVCNDMTSRDIESANPLYLPQAKTYSASCALGLTITPSWLVEQPASLGIRMVIQRDATKVYDEQASTSQLRRSFGELVGHLFHSQVFPAGVLLSTGTCLVPPLDEPLAVGDVITISIEQVGTLTNTVTTADRLGGWLDARRHAPATKPPESEQR